MSNGHGVTITKSPMDWEIVQQINGFAKIQIEGTYEVHKAALEVGVESALPVVRVVKEEDNCVIVPWSYADEIFEGENFSGTFKIEVEIPAGGLYRIDTSLETKSTTKNLTWLYRGDCILHFGVGDLFIIAGQSNASGYSRDYTKDEPKLGIHLFRNRGKWDIASHPMNESTEGNSRANEEMGIPGPSPYLSFGKSLNEFTNYPVGLIQSALGGSEIARWNPKTGDLYENLLDVIDKTKGKYKGILWYQGCSDTELDKAKNYYENFEEIVFELRKKLGYEIPFFTFQLNRQVNCENDVGYGMVREAQRLASEKINSVYILSTTNCSLCDGIHNTAQANVALGIKLAKQYFINILSNEKNYFSPPDINEVKKLQKSEKEILNLEGNWLKLVYKNVVRNFLLFSSLGKDSGFTIEDKKGNIIIEEIRTNREDRNFVYLKLDRNPKEEILISFTWESNPIVQPFVDEVTWLPPLSCFKREFYISEGEE